MPSPTPLTSAHLASFALSDPPFTADDRDSDSDSDSTFSCTSIDVADVLQQVMGEMWMPRDGQQCGMERRMCAERAVECC